MDIKALLEKTADAFSFKRYGKSGWASAIRVLKSFGLNDEQIEGFLRSKHMRWAGDHDEKRRWGRLNGVTVREYITKYPQYISKKELNQLI